MRIFFATPDGRVKYEMLRLNKKILELNDGGYYPVPPEAIFHDDKHKRGSIMVYFQDCLCPVGAKLPLDAVYDLQDECEMIKVARRNYSLSKRWHRLLAAFGDYFLKYGIPVLVFMFILLTLLASLLGGP